MSGGIPLWDILPLNSYLMTLFPFEDALRFLPHTIVNQSQRQDVCDVLRMVGGAGLLWSHHTKQRYQHQSQGTITTSYHQRQWRIVVLLFVMDSLPTAYRIIREQWNMYVIRRTTSLSYGEGHHRSTTTNTSMNNSNNNDHDDPLRHVALERRQQVTKRFQTLWPLVRLGLWLRLASSSQSDENENDVGTNKVGDLMKRIPLSLPLLYPIYGHRRWMQELLMELWPTVFKPILDSHRETKQFIRHILFDSFNHHHHHS